MFRVWFFVPSFFRKTYGHSPSIGIRPFSDGEKRHTFQKQKKNPCWNDGYRNFVSTRFSRIDRYSDFWIIRLSFWLLHRWKFNGVTGHMGENFIIKTSNFIVPIAVAVICFLILRLIKPLMSLFIFLSFIILYSFIYVF